MATAYNQDMVVWANEQAAFLRAGRLSALDAQQIAEELEGMGRSEHRELASRMAVLLMHLLKWAYQPEKRGNGRSWRLTIRVQRKSVGELIEDSPSLKRHFDDFAWCANVWDKALSDAVKETNLPLETFPETCPWTIEQVLDPDFFPGDPEAAA